MYPTRIYILSDKNLWIKLFTATSLAKWKFYLIAGDWKFDWKFSMYIQSTCPSDWKFWPLQMKQFDLKI